MAILDKAADFGVGTVEGAWNGGWRTVRNTALLVGGLTAIGFGMAAFAAAPLLLPAIGTALIAGAVGSIIAGIPLGLFLGQYGAAIGALTGGFKKVASGNAQRDQNLELEQGEALQEHSNAVKRVKGLGVNTANENLADKVSLPAEDDRWRRKVSEGSNKGFDGPDKGSAQKEAPESASGYSEPSGRTTRSQRNR